MTIALLSNNTNSHWPSLYITDDRGKLLANLANARTALLTDAGLSNALAYDASCACRCCCIRSACRSSRWTRGR
jgi:hypothetical protein